jgi:hypothetical protein
MEALALAAAAISANDKTMFDGLWDPGGECWLCDSPGDHPALIPDGAAPLTTMLIVPERLRCRERSDYRARCDRRPAAIWPSVPWQHGRTATAVILRGPAAAETSPELDQRIRIYGSDQ